MSSHCCSCCAHGFGILEPDEALSGFGSDIIVILSSVFVISGALSKPV
jgi:hypothetical protein